MISKSTDPPMSSTKHTQACISCIHSRSARSAAQMEDVDVRAVELGVLFFSWNLFRLKILQQQLYNTSNEDRNWMASLNHNSKYDNPCHILFYSSCYSPPVPSQMLNGKTKQPNLLCNKAGWYIVPIPACSQIMEKIYIKPWKVTIYYITNNM